MVVAIPLRGCGGNKVAYVDDEDLEKVVGFSWKAHRSKSTFYADRQEKRDGKTTTILMHRVIAEPKADELVDHWDHRGFNNRRANLRPCTKSTNAANHRPGRHVNPTGFRGVTRHKDRWKARICIKNRTTYLGVYSSAEDAARAYDHAAIEAFGEFAQPNFGTNDE